MENRVIIDKNGSLRVESKNGTYTDGLHSCLLAGDFMISSQSVTNLILQYESKGGFKRIWNGNLKEYCSVYISNEEIVKELQERDKKIEELEDKLCATQREKNVLEHAFENLRTRCEGLESREEKRNKKWWSRIKLWKK